MTDNDPCKLLISPQGEYKAGMVLAVLALMVSEACARKGQSGLAKDKSHRAGCGAKQLTATHPLAGTWRVLQLYAASLQKPHSTAGPAEAQKVQ